MGPLSSLPQGILTLIKAEMLLEALDSDEIFIQVQEWMDGWMDRCSYSEK